MRRWILYLGAFALVLALGISPFSGTDVGKLLPVEVVRLSYQSGKLVLETDTGDSGVGTDAMLALQNLKDTTAGIVFLETADYLIIEPGCEERLTELQDMLRPACGICFGKGNVKLEEAAKFLRTHSPKVTMQDWEGGQRDLPILIAEGERMELVQ